MQGAAARSSPRRPGAGCATAGGWPRTSPRTRSWWRTGGPARPPRHLRRRSWFRSRRPGMGPPPPPPPRRRCCECGLTGSAGVRVAASAHTASLVCLRRLQSWLHSLLLSLLLFSSLFFPRQQSGPPSRSSCIGAAASSRVSLWQTQQLQGGRSCEPHARYIDSGATTSYSAMSTMVAAACLPPPDARASSSAVSRRRQPTGSRCRQRSAGSPVCAAHARDRRSGAWGVSVARHRRWGSSKSIVTTPRSCDRAHLFCAHICFRSFC